MGVTFEGFDQLSRGGPDNQALILGNRDYFVLSGPDYACYALGVVAADFKLLLGAKVPKPKGSVFGGRSE